jgi:heat shock protein HslJ
MKLLTYLSTGILIILSGLAFKEESNVQESIYDSRWDLKTIHTDTGTVNTGTKAFIRFDEAKKSAGGNGSCNSFGSNLVISGQSISFENIFSTKMYCEAVQQTENQFFSLLDKVTSFQVTGKKLSLYAGEVLVLEFEKERNAGEKM